MATKRYRNSSHWGAYLAEVENGRVTGVKPFEEDPNPSPMLESIPHSVHTDTRVMQPFIREGWLKNGPGNGEGRGREPFVPVSWEKAYDLVSKEIKRVKETYSNDSILGGSYGWSSAGTFHHARMLIRKFLFAAGGCVDQSSNYSFGAAMAFVPHVAGDMRSVTGPLTSWSAVERHAKNLVVFGGINPKNTQAARGGNVAHEFLPSMKRLSAAGVNVVNVSPCRDDAPEFLNPLWIAIRPNTDTAMMLALAHTLIVEDLHDADFLEKYCELRDDGYCWNKSSGRRIVVCLPMHTFGFPVQLDEIKQICNRYNINLVEDAAESLGSLYKGHHTGGGGKLSAISFNGNKIVTTGGGGMILTNDEDLAVRAKHITTTAKVPHNWVFEHDEVGFNYRLPNLNAALGVAQMESLPTYLESKRNLAKQYQEWGDNYGLKFVQEPDNTQSNYWLNVAVTRDKEQRDAMLETTNKYNVMTRPTWIPMHKLAINQDCLKGSMVNTEWLNERIVNVPSTVILNDYD